MQAATMDDAGVSLFPLRFPQGSALPLVRITGPGLTSAFGEMLGQLLKIGEGGSDFSRQVNFARPERTPPPEAPEAEPTSRGEDRAPQRDSRRLQDKPQTAATETVAPVTFLPVQSGPVVEAPVGPQQTGPALTLPEDTSAQVLPTPDSNALTSEPTWQGPAQELQAPTQLETDRSNPAPPVVWEPAQEQGPVQSGALKLRADLEAGPDRTFTFMHGREQDASDTASMEPTPYDRRYRPMQSGAGLGRELPAAPSESTGSTSPDLSVEMDLPRTDLRESSLEDFAARRGDQQLDKMRAQLRTAILDYQAEAASSASSASREARGASSAATTPAQALLATTPASAAAASAMEASAGSGQGANLSSGAEQGNTGARGAVGATMEAKAGSFIERLRAQQPESGTRQNELIDRIVRVTRMQLSRGRSSIRMLLHPPQLGSLRVELAMRNGVLNASMKVDTQAAQHMLNTNLHELRASLAEQGVDIGSFEVSVDQGFDSAAGFEPSGSEQQQQQHGLATAGLATSRSDRDSETPEGAAERQPLALGKHAVDVTV